MPEVSTVCLVIGVLLQLLAWGRRAFVPSPAGPGWAASLVSGSLLVGLYAWRDADFTLLFGQVFLAAAYRPIPSLFAFRRSEGAPQ